MAIAIVIGFGLIPAVLQRSMVRPAGRDCSPSSPDWLTLITYAFLHADFWHLLGNMLFLWVFADNIEDAFGHVRFLIFYLLCAIGAGLVFVLSDPESQTPLVGASGAIAGVVAAYLMLHPQQKIWVLVLFRIPLRLRAFWVLGFWVLFQFYSILVAQPSEQVAWWAHVGGLVTGAILVLVLRRRGVPLFDRAACGRAASRRRCARRASRPRRRLPMLTLPGPADRVRRRFKAGPKARG